MSLQEAVHRAAYTRNFLISAMHGFRAFQLVYGRNPGIAGLSECSTSSLETFTPNELSRKMIDKMTRAGELMNETDSDLSLRTAMKDRLPRESNRFIEIGEAET